MASTRCDRCDAVIEEHGIQIIDNRAVRQYADHQHTVSLCYGCSRALENWLHEWLASDPEMEQYT